VITGLAAEHRLPAENLLSPDTVRRLAWEPPQPPDSGGIAAALTASGARAWQVGLTAGLLAAAMAHAEEQDAGPDESAQVEG
jgi:ribonuclease D